MTFPTSTATDARSMSTLWRDLPHHTQAIYASGVCCPVEITVGIESHVAPGPTSVTTAGEVVKRGVGPTGVRGSQLENVAVSIGPVSEGRAVQVAGRIHREVRV